LNRNNTYIGIKIKILIKSENAIANKLSEARAMIGNIAVNCLNSSESYSEKKTPVVVIES